MTLKMEGIEEVIKSIGFLGIQSSVQKFTKEKNLAQ